MPARAFLASLLLLVPAGSSIARPADRPATRLVDQPITVFIVRHAEKGPEEVDPGLTAKGRRRADDLARALREADVTALFATEFKRTRATVAPLAKALGLNPTILRARDVDTLVTRLLALPPGTRAVVVSHSNLAHLIVAQLSGWSFAPIPDTEFDRMFVVMVTRPGTGTAVALRYGEESGGGVR